MEPAGFANKMNSMVTEFFPAGVTIHLQSDCTTRTINFVGYTGFLIPAFESFFTPCVEIGWRYKKEVWGNGFATEAANACLKYGFEVLKFDKIVSFTSRLNINSEKLMRRVGMTYVTDFEHPNIEKENILCPHVLYQIYVTNLLIR